MAKQIVDRVELPPHLRAWRKRENLTQDEAARLLNLNFYTYIQYETGHRGKGISDFTYQHIIDVTRNSQRKPKRKSKRK